MQAYDQINYYKAQLRFADQLDSIYANFKTAAQLRYDTGETGKLEFISASSEFQQIQVLRQQAFDDIEIAKRALKQYLGTDESIETISEPYKTLDFMATLDSISVANNPMLQYALQNAEVSKANVGVEKSQFLPKFSFSYGRQVVDEVSGFNTYQAGISIPCASSPASLVFDTPSASLCPSSDFGASLQLINISVNNTVLTNNIFFIFLFLRL